MKEERKNVLKWLNRLIAQNFQKNLLKIGKYCKWAKRRSGKCALNTTNKAKYKVGILFNETFSEKYSIWTTLYML